jgi:preprotein translocase subunit YajC
VLKVEDDFLLFEAADKIELKLQKGAVSAVLPKGTIKSI